MARGSLSSERNLALSWCATIRHLVSLFPILVGFLRANSISPTMENGSTTLLFLTVRSGAASSTAANVCNLLIPPLWPVFLTGLRMTIRSHSPLLTQENHGRYFWSPLMAAHPCRSRLQKRSRTTLHGLQTEPHWPSPK